MSERTVCLIGFGEVGQTLARDLRAHGFTNTLAERSIEECLRSHGQAEI